MAEGQPQQPAESSSGAQASSRGTPVKLFLGGLSWETTEETVREHFQRYGSEMSEVIVMKDKVTGKPRGFGFVTFTNSEAADRVCQDVHTIDGRQIDVKRSVPQEHKPRIKKVFVGGLAAETTEDVFREYFERYGPVAEVQIMQDHSTGRSRGFGFVTYVDEASVEKVFAAGTMHELSGKRVEVKPATPRGSGPMGGGRGMAFMGGRLVGPRGPYGMQAPYAPYGAQPGQPGYGLPSYAGAMGGYPAGHPAMMGGYAMGPAFQPAPYGAYPGMLMQQPQQQLGAGGYGYGAAGYGGYGAVPYSMPAGQAGFEGLPGPGGTPYPGGLPYPGGAGGAGGEGQYGGGGGGGMGDLPPGAGAAGSAAGLLRYPYSSQSQRPPYQ